VGWLCFSRQDKKITKGCILAALGIGETWFKDAEDGSRLARMYGAGGQGYAEAVENEINAVRNPPLGRAKLLEFLRNWEKAHPLHVVDD
jgi:hypothetical protein